MGGETLEQTAAVASMLGKYNVQVILDYGVEGKEGRIILTRLVKNSSVSSIMQLHNLIFLS